MSNFKEPYDGDVLVELIEQDRRYRILREVPTPFTDMSPHGEPPHGKCVAIVDVETTGLDAEQDRLIELAIMLVFVDDSGRICQHMGPVSWLEDPEVVIDPKITMITGLAAHQLVGQSINDKAAAALLDRADVIVAHNARFDAAFIEKRYPQLAGKPWACSCSEIDWLTLGFEGRSQQHLLSQHGWFSNAHRAANDVWSLFHLLSQENWGPSGHHLLSHMQRLLKTSSTDTVRVEAVGAPFAAKDRLKGRHYAWDAGRKIWIKEMSETDLAAERSWYREIELPPFRIATITACERHR